MSPLVEVNIGHSLRVPIRTESIASAYMANLLLTTSPRIVHNLLPPVLAPGTLREFSQVGDGGHLRQQEMSLLPVMVCARPRPHTLVRKVTVVGSHVLRFVSCHSCLAARRHQMRGRLPQLNAYNYDRVDNVDLLARDDEPTARTSGLWRIHPEPFQPDPLALPSGDEENSTLSIFNWKIYVGMLCIIAVQALLKLAYHEMFGMS